MTGTTRRVVAVALLAGALLIGLVIATGGGLSGGGSSPPPPAAPSPAPAASTRVPSGTIEGTLTGTARRIGGSAWQFNYRIKNRGKVPIAGLQLNGPASNLYDISTRTLWNFFGAGICHHGPNGVLIYWSTGLTSPTVLKPGGTLTFTFKSLTTGTVQDSYSLSWGSATPQFGRVVAPAGSTLPSPQKCTK